LVKDERQLKSVKVTKRRQGKKTLMNKSIEILNGISPLVDSLQPENK